MKKHIFVFLTLTSVCFCMQAQKQISNWAFGKNAGITFTITKSLPVTSLINNANDTILDNLPTPIITKINTREGCFSVSDYLGKLLFYSDGRSIWNSKNEVMNNGSGLTGHDSSAQSGIVLLYPGNPNKYIVVTINELANNGLAYPIVDMSLDNGSGDVVADQKNIPLKGGLGTLGESVTSIRHANGIDYWIVAPGRGNTTYFNAWLVTKDGVHESVITSSTTQQTSTSGASRYEVLVPNLRKTTIS